jgi:hypothetical protein
VKLVELDADFLARLEPPGEKAISHGPSFVRAAFNTRRLS